MTQKASAWQCDEDEPIFPMNVVHAQQQTEETAEMFEKHLKENADLREKLYSQSDLWGFNDKRER